MAPDTKEFIKKRNVKFISYQLEDAREKFQFKDIDKQPIVDDTGSISVPFPEKLDGQYVPNIFICTNQIQTYPFMS